MFKSVDIESAIQPDSISPIYLIDNRHLLFGVSHLITPYAVFERNMNPNVINHLLTTSHLVTEVPTIRLQQEFVDKYEKTPSVDAMVAPLIQTRFSSAEASVLTALHLFNQYKLQRNLTLLGLESEEFQKDLLSSLGFKFEQKDAEMAINMYDANDLRLSSLVDAIIYFVINDGDRMTYEKTMSHVKEMSYERNMKWFKKLTQQILPSIPANDHSSIVVGMSHLYGDGGLIDLFVKNGCSVKQIDAKEINLADFEVKDIAASLKAMLNK